MVVRASKTWRPVRVVFAAVVASLLAPVQDARAARSSEGEPEVRVVQQRQHAMRHEYTGWVGTLPMDAFTKGITFSGGYTFHLNEAFAWEVGQFTWSMPVDTALADELAALAQPVSATPFERVESMFTSNVVFKPLYGKHAVLNRGIVYSDLLFALGGGVGWMTLSRRPLVDVGVGWHVFLGRHVSLRVDVRDAVLITEGDRQNELWVATGLSVSHGG